VAVADHEAVKELYRAIRSSHDFDAAVIAKADDGKVRMVKKHEQPPVAALRSGSGGAWRWASRPPSSHRSASGSPPPAARAREALDEGQVGLVVVYAFNLADRVDATMKAATRVVSKATDMAAEELVADLEKAEESAAILGQRQPESAPEKAETTRT
jgi:hypothetical protein